MFWYSSLWHPHRWKKTSSQSESKDKVDGNIEIYRNTLDDFLWEKFTEWKTGWFFVRKKYRLKDRMISCEKKLQIERQYDFFGKKC